MAITLGDAFSGKFSAIGVSAILAIAPLVQGAAITSVSTSGGTVQLDASANNEGFLYASANSNAAPTQTNTSNGVLTDFSVVGDISTNNNGGFPFSETQNSTSIYTFQSSNPPIGATNNGINTGYGTQTNNGNGFEFTVANEPKDQTLHVYTGLYNATVALTVTPTNGSPASASASNGANDYLDYTVSIPANSGLTTISWVVTSQVPNGASNPSIFAVTAASVPEPASVGLICFAGLFLRRRVSCRIS